MKKIMTKQLVSLLMAGCALTANLLPAQPVTLAENNWNNPEFVKWFTGTFAFNGVISPQISSEEQQLFQQVAPLMANNPDGAIAALNQFITEFQRAHPQREYSAALDFTIGSIHLQSGRIDEAITQYQRALRRFPTFQRAHQNLGLARVQRGEFAEALTSLTKALELGGGSGMLYGLIGFSFLNTGRPTQALHAYEQALLFQPDSSDWRMGKLSALLAIGNRDTAIALLHEMINETPDSANLWLQQANAFMGNGDIMEAAINLEWVMRNGSASAPSLLLLGDIYLNEGLPHLALDVYKRTLELSEVEPVRLLRVAEALFQRGAFAQSTEFLQEWQQRAEFPTTGSHALQVLNLQAQLALASGDATRAAELLEQVIARDPLNGGALLTLGDYYRETGDIQRAIFQYERATAVESVRPRALLALARIYVAKLDYRRAIQYLREVQVIQPRPYIADYIDQLERIMRRS